MENEINSYSGYGGVASVLIHDHLLLAAWERRALAMPNLDRELVNIVDAARTACISRSKLHEFIGFSELPTVRLGKRRLVRVEALRAWIAAEERRAG